MFDKPENMMTSKELIDSLDIPDEGKVIMNPYTGNETFVEPLGVALYYYIKECEANLEGDKMELAEDVFRSHYPHEYYVLLD